MNESSIALVYAVLIAAGHRPERARWMADSCPSLARAKEIAGADRRTGRYALNSQAEIPPSAVLVGELHKKWRATKGADAFADLQRAIDAHYEAA